MKVNNMEITPQIKGDIAVAKTIVDLTEKEYTTFIPTISGHLRFDLVAYKNNVFYKIQCKYSPNGLIYGKTPSNEKGKYLFYKEGDFDYYAIYSPKINKVLYPSIKYKDSSIAIDIPSSPTPFYWWEDFINFTDNAEKKTYKDFGLFTKGYVNNGLTTFSKITIPPKELLSALLWEKPINRIADQFNVNYKTIDVWVKYYGLTKPYTGYWSNKKVIDKSSGKSLEELYKEYNSEYKDYNKT